METRFKKKKRKAIFTNNIKILLFYIINIKIILFPKKNLLWGAIVFDYYGMAPISMQRVIHCYLFLLFFRRMRGKTEKKRKGGGYKREFKKVKGNYKKESL